MKKNRFDVCSLFLKFVLSMMVLMLISLTIDMKFACAQWEFYNDVGAGVELCEAIKARLKIMSGNLLMIDLVAHGM